MPWPTPQDYNEAIQNPNQNFADSELSCGAPELGTLGLPRPITGNFASVYRMHCGGRDWAVRCFWREYADMPVRYAAISSHLHSARLPHTVGFEYLTRGIRIRGHWYPILKMEWVEGELLHEYVYRNLNDRAALSQLANRWVEMIEALEAASVAHGDLQHGNVLVVNGMLRLVDYDAMYVPALSGRGSHEIGHQNYQHPRRSGAHYGAWIDRFSAWVVYVSLEALAADPALWSRTQAGDERLILKKADFCAPATSATLKLLREHADARVRAAASGLESCLHVEPANATSLRLANGGASPGTRSRVRRPYGRTVARAVSARTAWRLVVPSGSGIVVDRYGPSAAVTLPSWLQDHVTPLGQGRRTFSSRPRLPQIICLASLVAMAGVIGLTTLTAWITLPVLLTVLAATSLCDLAVLGAGFRHDRTVAELGAILKRERVQSRAVGRLEREVARLEGESERTDSRLTAERDRADRARGELARHEAAESKTAQSARDAAISSCTERLVAIDTEERAAFAHALEDLQARHIRSVLKHSSLWSAHLPTLVWTARARLWASGIRCAADLSTERIKDARWLPEPTLLELVAWRVDQERLARRGMPRTLPTDVRTLVSEAFSRRRVAVEMEQSRAVARERRLSQIISDRYAKRALPVDARLQQAERQYETKRAEIDANLGEAARRAAVEHRTLASIRCELEGYEAISFGRYLLHMLTPRLTHYSSRSADHPG